MILNDFLNKINVNYNVYINFTMFNSYYFFNILKV